MVYTYFMIPVVILLMCALPGCFQGEKPPYFTAEVSTVYKENFTVDRFRILYWWEERGETPFLKPYEHFSKELVLEVMNPHKDNPRRVSIETIRIPLEQIDRIDFRLSDVGKDMSITLKDGKNVIATTRFPKVLRKGEDTGIADHKLFVNGKTVQDSKEKELKLDFNILKTIRIIKIDHS